MPVRFLRLKVGLGSLIRTGNLTRRTRETVSLEKARRKEKNLNLERDLAPALRVAKRRMNPVRTRTLLGLGVNRMTLKVILRRTRLALLLGATMRTLRVRMGNLVKVPLVLTARIQMTSLTSPRKAVSPLGKGRTEMAMTTLMTRIAMM
jgi:hypothetical protein